MGIRDIHDDEWYTRLEDIAKEINHYKDFLSDKIVYLNCDNAIKSNFYKYFYDNFSNLNLRLLISTYYNENNTSIKYVYDGIKTISSTLNCNGDFRSEECVEILKSADVIITNPPFSLFEDLLDLIISNNKYFLIVGNQNAITYKRTFTYLMEHELWLGCENGPSKFIRPDGSIKETNTYWYTNIPHESFIKEKKYNSTYNEKLYPKYDNYEAIEVNPYTKIPNDYYGVMGIPITFIKYFDSSKFELLGEMSGPRGKYFINGNDGRAKFYINGEGKYARLLIKWKHKEE